MENVPALNANCFDKQIAERLQPSDQPYFIMLYDLIREPYLQ